jgi:hypothetical protein
MADGFSVTDFKLGDRIRLHPATDLFMRGIRYATVTQVGRTRILAKSDQGRELNLSPTHIIEIIDLGPNPAEEHPFQADHDQPLYCRECGASETDHRL